jgi:hypothetical protein
MRAMGRALAWRAQCRRVVRGTAELFGPHVGGSLELRGGGCESHCRSLMGGEFTPDEGTAARGSAVFDAGADGSGLGGASGADGRGCE